MSMYNEKIREIAKELLESGKVKAVIGFAKGSIPLTNKPVYITNPEKVSSLIWDSNCRINLANYIDNYKNKVALLAKGCDSRNIVLKIKENKIDRKYLHIIGIPCQGMIDKIKIKNLIQDEIIESFEKENNLIIRTKETKQIIVNKKEILQENCRFCSHKNPVINDEIINNNIKDKKYQFSDKYSNVIKIENLETEKKWSYFNNMFSLCIRCYACRNICPLCYCPTCFVDESNPQWVGKGQKTEDIFIFHFLRAYHCSGRCTNCGSCEQSCPLKINMRTLTEKLTKECEEEFSSKIGISINNHSTLDTYNLKDSDSLID